MSLLGKSVIVTGGGRGIGRAIARRLAADGANVVVNDIDAEAAAAVAKEIASNDRRAVAAPGDVSERAAVERIVATCVRDFGKLDMMIANAGIVQVKRLLDIGEDDLDRILRVNVRGVLNCMQAGARAMIAAGRGGKIIAASSISGRQGFAFMAHYSASKFAIIGLVQAAAKELAGHQITVNAYCPGMVQTDMAETIDAGVGACLGLPKGAATAEFSKMIALGRLERPEEVAGLVAFLCSADADYMTGQAVAIDGGITFN